MFTKQDWYCNCCGKSMNTVPHAAIGRTWRVCSLECLREMQWRDALSCLGEAYRADPRR